MSARTAKTDGLTRFANLSPSAARVFLVVAVVSIEYSAVRSYEVDPATINVRRLDRCLNDQDLYVAVSDRVRRGEDYYAAASAELVRRHYPTGSAFQWRMPTYAWIFGRTPTPAWGRWMLLVLAVFAMTTAYSAARRSGSRASGIATVTVLAASYGWIAFPQPSYFMELWSGLFILGAACLLSVDRWRSGAVCAGLALGCRELALPFVVVATLGALAFRHHRAALILLLIIGVFLLSYWLHVRAITRYATLDTSGLSLPWITFGGLPFVLSTCRMNFILAVLPVWCTAVYMPLSLLGLLGWRGQGPALLTATTVGYMSFFVIVGLPFNFYWGWMTMPLLVLGFVRAFPALRDLLTAATK